MDVLDEPSRHQRESRNGRRFFFGWMCRLLQLVTASATNTFSSFLRFPPFLWDKTLKWVSRLNASISIKFFRRLQLKTSLLINHRERERSGWAIPRDSPIWHLRITTPVHLRRRGMTSAQPDINRRISPEYRHDRARYATIFCRNGISKEKNCLICTISNGNLPSIPYCGWIIINMINGIQIVNSRNMIFVRLIIRLNGLIPIRRESWPRYHFHIITPNTTTKSCTFSNEFHLKTTFYYNIIHRPDCSLQFM